MPGEKKAWAKKARRRHSVAPTKFTHHEGDKLLGRSTPFAEEIAEEVDEETVEDSAEEAVEEAVEDSAVEEVTKGDKLLGRSSSDEPEEPENESPSESLPLDDSPENEQAEEIVEELEVIEEQPDQADEEQPEELAEEQLEQADETPFIDSDEEPIEEEPIEEEIIEEIGEDPAEDSEETVEDLAESPVEDSVEEVVEEVEEETEEEAEEEIADELVDEETTEDLGEYVDELSRELDALDEQKGDKLPGRSTPFERPKQTPQEKPTKRMRLTPAPAPAPAPEPVERPKPTKREKPAPESTPTPIERPKPTKCEKPKPAPEPKPTPAAAARQKPTKRKKAAPRYRYIKSPSLEQAFRNLLRLDAGAAWRATRIPLVAFFLCFALLALAIADQAPAIDSFNATINALVHGTRGMLDGFFVTITTLGDLLPMTALCLIVCAILVIARKWDSLAFFATNVLLAVVCVQALKFIFAVPRPGAETLVPIPGSFSFPSAHSFCSLIVLGMIGLLIFRALNRKGVPYNVAIVPGIILVIFAILIGISRIYVGVHWPSDVLGGWLLAGMWLPFASALYTVGARKR